MKIRFKVDGELCIPAMACIVAEPDIYELVDSGKADIKNAMSIEGMRQLARDGEWVVLETDEKGFNRVVESAKVCPVLAIFVEVEEKDGWKRVYPE